MASRIRDLFIMFLPSEWGRAGINVSAASPGPNPPPPPGDRQFGELGELDLLELRMVAQLLLARLGGPVTLGEMEPRSLSDVNELEIRLAAALEDLKRKRADLEKS
jgi:hypothetical protein